MFDLDNLYKKYLFYKLKKSVPWFLLLSFVGISFYIALIQFDFFSVRKVVDTPTKKLQENSINKSDVQQSTASKKQVIHKSIDITKKENHNYINRVKKEKDNKEENKYYKFFTLALQEKDLDKLQRIQKKYKKLGLSCNIEKQNNLLNLVCGKTDNYEEAQAVKMLLKKHHIPYFLVVKNKEEETQEPIIKSVVLPKKKELLSATPEKEVSNIIEKQESRQESFLKHTNVDNKSLEKMYAKNKNYATAIKIAKNYYEKGLYEKSLYWAKEANGLDRKKEESWIIYARSLYALGKRDKAVKILTLYKRFASSQKIENILREWKNNDK